MAEKCKDYKCRKCQFKADCKEERVRNRKVEDEFRIEVENRIVDLIEKVAKLERTVQVIWDWKRHHHTNQYLRLLERVNKLEGKK